MTKTFTFFKSIMVLCMLLGFSVNAQTVTVINTSDSGPGSLRQAVIDIQSGGTIIFNPSTNGTITLNSEIAINKSITINGNGSTFTTVSGNNMTRIFAITNAGTVTLNNLAFTNGSAADGGAINAAGSTLLVNNTSFMNNTATGAAATQGGGAIFKSGGMLTVSASTFTNNKATGAAGSGGAILVSTGGNLTANGTTFTGNTASRAGGGIEGNSGAGTTITLSDVTLTNNITGSAPGNGGGLHITGAGNTIINNGTVSGNIAAAEGGGLWNGSGTMTIQGTLITNNTASGIAADNGGGGIYNLSGVLNINTGTKITNNKADGTAGSGGGILNDAGGKLTINSAEITGNTSNRAGGGIEDNSGAMGNVTISATTLNGNTTFTTPGNGGGLHVTGAGTVVINGGIVSNNKAGAEGGGLWNGTGTMTIDGTTISANTASGVGTDQGGGGIYNLNAGTLNIKNATISNNVADGAAGSGGGILNDVGSKLTINDSQITSNISNRAGGGIEDNSGAAGNVTLTNVALNGNTTNTSPGNGGGLHVTGAGTVVIKGGTVNNNKAGAEGGGLWNGTGSMNIDGTTISTNTASGAGADQGGGGIYNLNAGTVTIINAVISNNIANGTAGSGGGILNDVGSKLSITNSKISGNTAVRAGGGIEDNSGTSTIVLNNVELTGNSVSGPPGNGGGLHITGAGSATITGGIVSGNTATEGGGLWNATGTLTVENVTISGNTATGLAVTDGGGGIYNNGGTLVVNRSTISGNRATGLLGMGGAVHLNGGTAVMQRTTVSGNSSVSNAGGIYNNGTLNIDANTITLNASVLNGGGIYNADGKTTTFKNSIVSGNLAVVSGRDLLNNSGTITSNGYNLVGILEGNAFTATANDITGTLVAPLNAGLMPLADNGGSTLTHRLSCPNAAADMGDPQENSNDQLGMAVFNGRRDIGAYEAQEVCATAGTDDFVSTSRSMVFPNPSVNGIFNLQLSQIHGSDATVTIYEIASGKIVKSFKANTATTEIGMNGFSNGVYVMQVVSGTTTENHKIIIGR
jgi:hypothetical protein